MHVVIAAGFYFPEQVTRWWGNRCYLLLGGTAENSGGTVAIFQMVRHKRDELERNEGSTK